jgi:hypothetical protein
MQIPPVFDNPEAGPASLPPDAAFRNHSDVSIVSAATNCRTPAKP